MSEDNTKYGWDSEFSDDLIEFTQPDIMVKLVSTIDSRGWPHLTIITSNRAKKKRSNSMGAIFCRHE